ncbi:hypothetical protein BBJ29_006589 [Phytophthora kernoviae]|uniref:DUSP domain-containing protein n=1 Tax=Phytophthora kernoviae TaxID=325452 RepID=A0A421G4R2_9STRA|nr:hypothetical protein BBJ29_006589 [Phytophthora kernoviae]
MVKGKTTLERVKKLPTDSILEEGDQWFAVATPWWEEFQACQPAENAPSVRNEALIDKHFSSKDRKVAIFHWMNDQAEPEELADDLSRLVVVLGSRIHTVGHLLAEVWLAAPGAFRRCFPQFVGGFASVAALSVTPKAAKSSTQTRVCYRYVRATDSESTWTAIDKLVKRRRTLLQLKPRASKRQACDTGKLESNQEIDDDEQSGTEFDESGDQLKGDPTGLREIGDIKLGDLRLDDRSEIASVKGTNYGGVLVSLGVMS